MDWVGLIKELVILGFSIYLIHLLFQLIMHSNELDHRAELKRERQKQEEKIISSRQGHEKELLLNRQKHEVIMCLIRENGADYFFKRLDELNKLLSHYDIHDGKDKNKTTEKSDK